MTGATCVGAAEGKSSFSVAAQSFDWDKRPQADIDREFTVGDIPPGRCLWIGSYSDTPIETEVELIVGHRMTDDVSAGQARRERDLEQIVRRLCWPANYPTGVLAITYRGASVITTAAAPDGAWVTRIRFAMQYLGTASGE